MFTDFGFFIAWAIIAAFFLVLAILIPETWRAKIVAILLVLIITFGFTIMFYQGQKVLTYLQEVYEGLHLDRICEFQVHFLCNLDKFLSSVKVFLLDNDCFQLYTYTQKRTESFAETYEALLKDQVLKPLSKTS